MMQPLVSIIVTSYNHAQFIGKALDSVFAQTYKNIEVIVVDDASVDGSSKIIRRYQKKHNFHYIERAENYHSQKVKQGEKPGVEAMLCAKGKYISVVDSDDFIYPDKISRQVAMMEKNESAALCYGGIQVMMENGQCHQYSETFPSGDIFNTLLINGNHILFIGSIIRNSSFKSIRRSHPDVLQEDWDMFLRLAKCGPFIADEQNVACYRRHGGNTWFRNDKELLMYENRMIILDEWIRESAWPQAMDIRWDIYMKNRKLDDESLNTLLIKRPKDALLNFLKFMSCFNKKQLAEAENYLTLSIKYCDDRLAILPTLYKFKMHFAQTKKEKKLLTHELNFRLLSLGQRKE